MAEQVPLRIWHVDSGKRRGGGQIQIALLLRGLTERGVACTLICPVSSPIPDLDLPRQVTVIHLPLRGEWDLWSAWRLKRLIRSHRPNILHAHDAHSHTLCLLARSPEIRLVVHRRVSFPIRRHRLTGWKYGRRVDHFVAVAESVRAELLEAGVPGEKISVIPSALDLSRFSDDPRDVQSLRGELGLDGERVVIGTVGRLSREKRHEWLLETLAPVLRDRPSACVVLVGEGPERSRLEHLAKRCGIDQQVLFTGYREDACRLLPIFDVYVLCSESEGYPVSLLEAMAAGCAVVSTDVGGAREIVSPGENGMLVRPDDAGAFRDALNGLLDDSDGRTRMGCAAREMTRKSRGAEMMVDSVLHLYNRIRAPRG